MYPPLIRELEGGAEAPTGWRRLGDTCVRETLPRGDSEALCSAIVSAVPVFEEASGHNLRRLISRRGWRHFFRAVHRQMVELAFKSGPIDAALDRFCAVIDKAADILPAALGLVLGGALHLQKALLAADLAHLNKAGAPSSIMRQLERHQAALEAAILTRFEPAASVNKLPKPTNESDPELKNAFIQLTCPSDDFRLTLGNVARPSTDLGLFRLKFGPILRPIKEVMEEVMRDAWSFDLLDRSQTIHDQRYDGRISPELARMARAAPSAVHTLHTATSASLVAAQSCLRAGLPACARSIALRAYEARGEVEALLELLLVLDPCQHDDMGMVEVQLEQFVKCTAIGELGEAMWQSKRLLLERAGTLEACVAAKAGNDFDCHVHLRVATGPLSLCVGQATKAGAAFTPEWLNKLTSCVDRCNEKLGTMTDLGDRADWLKEFSAFVAGEAYPFCAEIELVRLRCYGAAQYRAAAATAAGGSRSTSRSRGRQAAPGAAAKRATAAHKGGEATAQPATAQEQHSGNSQTLRRVTRHMAAGK
ncbi:hypothetical protein COHA_005678 [Chlorella ohadii]|uniref:Uncharacterized protein n=1 Tax=Chlorella ohadii TaxID=2649997 RepID=A0AAD5DN53_9CHLO|nr:hypothetical protein COHA_005678 [Chlorella ohadii]